MAVIKRLPNFPSLTAFGLKAAVSIVLCKITYLDHKDFDVVVMRREASRTRRSQIRIGASEAAEKLLETRANTPYRFGISLWV